MAQVITIASGLDGVGKTTIAVNLALQLARLKQRVCLFDADVGLASMQSVLGVNKDGSLKEVLGPRHSLADLLVQQCHGIDLLPDSPAMEQLDGSDSCDWNREETFTAMQDYHFFLIDGSRSTSRDTLACCLASSEVVIVVTPEPDSLTSAYSLIRKLHMNGYRGKVKAVVNRCKTIDDGRQAYETLHKVILSYMDFDVPLMGLLFEDAELATGPEERQAITLRQPESVAARGIRDLATELVDEQSTRADEEELQFFWSRLLWLLGRPLLQPRSSTESRPAGPVNTGSTAPRTVRTTVPQAVPALPLVNQMVSTLGSWLGRVREWQTTANANDQSIAVNKGFGAQLMARLLRNYSFEKQQVGYRQAKMDIYYVEQDSGETLTCALHSPDEVKDISRDESKTPSVGGEQIKR